jgi:diaminopimelate epimerase
MKPGIPFVKATACGNDFLLIAAKEVRGDRAELARRICDRNFGVGADGVEYLETATDADVACRLFNADGSEAEISGNGTRCVAAHFIAGRGGVEQKNVAVRIRTGAGVKVCVLTRCADPEFEFEVAMGEVEVKAEVVLALDSGSLRGVPVAMGNPHVVVFVEEFPVGWQGMAQEIARQLDFKQGVNVELVKIDNEGEISARFFERGVGETLSSGTGSCASAAAAVAAGRVRWPVRVQTAGGTQQVRGEAGQIFLRGSARLVARGEFLGAAE